ncbi:MAG: ankyrin repeat domain-containing protein [Gemmataceae bacterium]|nr:ankyrin repeat domain-containing protein [Gemmataceae bacterium]
MTAWMQGTAQHALGKQEHHEKSESYSAGESGIPMIDWGDEVKPRPHSGRIGIDRILKDARRGDLQAVHEHLQRDPSLLRAKSGGHNRTFLWEATRGNCPRLVKYLIEAGADPNAPGRIRSVIVVLLKPLCIARRYGRTATAELLVQAGTVMDIYSACFLGDAERVRELLERDPTLLVQEQEDDSVWRVTPLHFAVAGGHAELTLSLIAQGAKVAPYTRLLCNAAVRMGHPELVQILLDGGADRELARIWAQP